MAEKILTPVIKEPANAFTQDDIVWKPWLTPIPEEDITDEQKTAFTSAAHVKLEYFRLLARDIPILKARSKSDQDIFYCPTLGELKPPLFRRQLQHFFFFTFGSYDAYSNTWSARPSSEIS
jgi:hypothetical protein